MAIFIAIQKWLACLGLLVTVAGGLYIADQLSWQTEVIGDRIIKKKMSGKTWTEMYEFDLDKRLLFYTYSDSEFQNHTISYDSETGEVTGRY